VDEALDDFGVEVVYLGSIHVTMNINEQVLQYKPVGALI